MRHPYHFTFLTPSRISSRITHTRTFDDVCFIYVRCLLVAIRIISQANGAIKLSNGYFLKLRDAETQETRISSRSFFSTCSDFCFTYLGGYIVN
ncbi:unnamed protein product [Nippostrongylus brasiliensis]|uniref:Secreted protein n=1 Tax=Nippostrongylus brasiliensis TaxID=27835 RepID=A0A0N4YQI7_NIPBR|nr:unnamed protein product [Nippostrongylus brasiliensis]